jgi:Papain fold toxin 2
MKKLFVVVIFYFIVSNVYGQLRQTFRDSIKAATAASITPNANLRCTHYADALKSFMTINASKYKGITWKQVKVTNQKGSAFIGHDDYPSASISDNGTHVFTIIEGYVFDNHHPNGGITEADYKKKLFSPDCITTKSTDPKYYPCGFNTGAY